MKISKNNYNQMFSGYSINAVAVKDNGPICFLTKERIDGLNPVLDSDSYKKRLVVYYNEENADESDQWGRITLSGLKPLRITTITRPLSQVVVAAFDGYVYSIGSCNSEEVWLPDKPNLRNVGSIDGNAYVVGNFRYAAKRIDTKNWQILNNGIETSSVNEDNFTDGFDFIDGFSETEIYAGGGRGDLWQYNGEKWHQIPFPSDMTLKSICCGKDGFAYIIAQNGIIFKGRNNEWKMIYPGAPSSSLRQMVWYQDRVWVTSDNGVWQIVDDNLIEADIPSEIKAYAGYIDCNDKTLVLAGVNGAARLENGEWDILIDCSEGENSLNEY